MPEWNVLVLDGLEPTGIEVLQSSKSIRVDAIKKISKEELNEKIARVDALVIRSATKVDRELLEYAPRLKLIGRAGIGVDNIDMSEATRRGILVMNTPSENTTTTAEHALALLLSLAKNIPQAHGSMREGLWEKSRFLGTELDQKTLGIVGLGNIGKIVAVKAAGFGMEVIAYDPYLTQELVRSYKATLVNLDTLLSRADVITVHTPLTASTRGLIGRSAFERMKRGVFLINAARGGIVVEEDLLWAIEEGIVAGVGLDVFEQEPLPKDHPFRRMNNVGMTPHIGAATKEAQRNVALGIAKQIVDYIEKGVLRNAVNFPAVPPEIAEQIEPFQGLAVKLGELMGQLWEGPVRSVRLEYKGELASVPVAILTSAFLKTFLGFMLGEKVNEVSAPYLAKERGIEIIEASNPKSADYTSLIAVTIQDGSRKFRVEGTVFGKNNPRVVRMEEFQLEFSPTGFILFLENRDVPGVVGRIGSELGKEGVNIAGLRLGREDIGGRAYALYHVDNDIPVHLLEGIRQMPDIIRAQFVRFQ
jgi:D-3-phosphoglycerate dehydrogenase